MFRIFSTEWVTKLVDLIIVTTGFSNATKTKFQIKTLGSAQTTTGVVTDLCFSNLTVGKIYKLTGYLQLQFSGATADTITVNASSALAPTRTIGRMRIDSPSSFNFHPSFGVSTTFQAATTTLTISMSNSGATQQIQAGSYLVLEELPNHEETTQWT